MTRAYDRHGCPPLPDYWRGPLRVTNFGPETLDSMAREMADTWLTAAEWLAWSRRPGVRVFSRGCWHWPLRPQVTAWPTSTRKIRKLP